MQIRDGPDVHRTKLLQSRDRFKRGVAGRPNHGQSSTRPQRMSPFADERIGPFLHADRRRRAMSGIDHGGVGERKQFAANPPEQEPKVSPQVRATDRAGEEYVASEHESGIELITEEDDRARTVTGNLTDLEHEVRDLYALT